MSTSVKVMAVLVARAGKSDELRALLAGMVGPSRGEPGNVQYDVWRDKANRDRFVVEERYLDETAAVAHHATPHFAHYLSTINDLAERTAMVLDLLDSTIPAEAKPASHEIAASGDGAPLGQKTRMEVQPASGS